MAKRNPPWVREDLMLALDVYMRQMGTSRDTGSARWCFRANLSSLGIGRFGPSQSVPIETAASILPFIIGCQSGSDDGPNLVSIERLSRFHVSPPVGLCLCGGISEAADHGSPPERKGTSGVRGNRLSATPGRVPYC